MRWPMLRVYATRFDLVLAPLPHSLVFVLWWAGAERVIPSSIHPPVRREGGREGQAKQVGDGMDPTHSLEEAGVGAGGVLPVAGRLHQLEVLRQPLADHLLQQLRVRLLLLRRRR